MTGERRDEDRAGGAVASLSGVLEEAASDLESVEERTTPSGREWSIGGIVFAATEGDGAVFRLSPAVSAAALRTPDTAASPRGRDWVLFRPKTLDRHAVDRAEAWLASAWRRADGES
jgi:hypothetical protein